MSNETLRELLEETLDAYEASTADRAKFRRLVLLSIVGDALVVMAVLAELWVRHG